ncbi:hypothetical protein LTR84_003861 [Exophiala bonariae]|uniref:X-Pro dipeptidyl-peptidase n=1 Tax=Exophiala bonariae TaxID=1690606 RepID=A0AAV9N766_9EURO|nr:hypothetical protein LTR84_003861 [Exophiala bonariae]
MVSLRKVPGAHQHPNLPGKVKVEEDVNSKAVPVDQETMPTIIQTVKEDLGELKKFYNITLSPTRFQKVEHYLEKKLEELSNITFGKLNQAGQVDYALLNNYLKSSLQRLRSDKVKDDEVLKLVGSFAFIIIELFEARQRIQKLDFQEVAALFTRADNSARDLKQAISSGIFRGKIERTIAYRTAYKLEELSSVLRDWHNFYLGYEPLYSWWVSQPYATFQENLSILIACIQTDLVGFDDSVKDPIIGEPIGRDGILADLDFEKIAYSPEELIHIGEMEYQWCEVEAKKASCEMGYGSDWRKALEHVKNMYVGPGQQIYGIHDLAIEATNYVKDHDLVTVPEIAETWRMLMISPERQKANPFFLGGNTMQVSYPTDKMSHEDKLMSMRGNSIPLSRSTVFHELIPGHHLQFHMIKRHRPYRRIFDTPFWMEGWALYWEFILWDKGFPGTPENRIGMLFWRMHRCARIIFSIKFHLGEMTPQECIDFLVDKVGHERATATGEVRRSFNGDYSPLYQAGYMLGALQLYALRAEVLQSGQMTEKEFHDKVLHENEMPIEVLRALVRNFPIDPDFRPSWKFYEKN